MAFDIFRYPGALLSQYQPILFPYARITQVQTLSARKPSGVGNPVQKTDAYLTAGTHLQHIAGIHFHSYHLQSHLSWPLTTPKSIISDPLTSKAQHIQSPSRRGTRRVVHASGEHLHTSLLMSRVAWPEPVPATFPVLPSPDLVLPHKRPVRLESMRPLPIAPSLLHVLSSGLNDLNVRISDTLDIDIGVRLESSNVTAHTSYRPSQSQKQSLNVDWQESTVEHPRESGLPLFEFLFSLLTQEDQLRLSSARPISRFTNISISVPTVVKNNANPHRKPGSGSDDGFIQLLHAYSLKEFSWNGHFTFLTSKFRRIPFLQLTVLKVSGCLLSLEDALSLLNTCPLLVSVTLDTIHDVEDSGQILFGHSELPNVMLGFLNYLNIASNVPLAPLFESLEWGGTLRNLVLILKDEGINDIPTYTSHFQSIQNLSVWGNITQEDVTEFLRCVQVLELNGHHLVP